MDTQPTIASIAAELRHAHGTELEALVTAHAADPRERVQELLGGAIRRLERERAEEARVRSMYELAEELGGSGLILGVDEVGRGAVAGPLTVAAVALPMEPPIIGLNDSKKLSAARRELLSEKIHEVARAIGIYHVPPTRIDAIGMARAIREAMAGAVRQATKAAGAEPDAVLIDGNPVHVHPREICVVRGDAMIAPIAGASIVAKVCRDAIMVEAEKTWPGYGFASCKGYAAASHIAAIREHGLTPYHRATFCTRFAGEQAQQTLF